MHEISLADLVEVGPTEAEARRVLEVCNACRYCEGFCAVFPAMILRREFTSGDLTYLGNLCHGCHGCYYACQYAPPHEFGINVPAALAEVRNESYVRHAWPAPLAAAFDRNGTTIALAMAAGITAVFLATILLQGPARLFDIYPTSPGQGFYSVVPYEAMLGVASISFLWAILAMAIGFSSFWRSIKGGASLLAPGPVMRSLWDAATLRYLGGGGHGCNDTDESFSTSRRSYHHVMAYGFLLCFASTITGTIYDHLLGWRAPYPFFSLPVLLGTFGGLGIAAGTLGLLWLKMKADREPQSGESLGADTGLLVLLLLTAVSGLLLLGLKSTSAMAIALLFHLGLVLSFFLVMPYSKFVHSIYRLAALLRFAHERRSN